MSSHSSSCLSCHTFTSGNHITLKKVLPTDMESPTDAIAPKNISSNAGRKMHFLALPVNYFTREHLFTLYTELPNSSEYRY